MIWKPQQVTHQYLYAAWIYTEPEQQLRARWNHTMAQMLKHLHLVQPHLRPNCPATRQTDAARLALNTPKSQHCMFVIALSLLPTC